MDADQSQTFNDRLSQWIASQGFWFQLRYSMSSGGGWSVAAFHLFKLTTRVLILLGIVALGFVIYLNKRVTSEGYSDGLEDKFVEAMSASDAEISGFDRAQGQARIRRFGSVGTPTSFFESVEAGNLAFKMGFLDGLSGDWDVGVIDGNWIDIQVKAGANSPEEAAAAAESLFRVRQNFDVRGLTFTKARVTWGHKEPVSWSYRDKVGEIDGSKMTANRTSEGWRFSFKGGKFTQNWIRGFDIDEFVMLCTPSELIVEKGLLSSGGGVIEFKDVKIVGGELPEISGRLIMKNVSIDSLVPEKIAERVSGSISAELELSGSTNTSDGISLTGPVTIGDSDEIQIRNEFPLLEALDVVDVYNSYKRVVFDQGGFNLKTGGGSLLVSGVDLEARDLMTLQGRLNVRYPTDSEAAMTIGANPNSMMLPVTDEEAQKKKRDITLKRAALAQREDEDDEKEGPEAKSELFAGLASKRDEDVLKHAAAQRALSSLVFDGGFRIAIPGDAFERSRILRERYPIDQATGRIGIDVPLRGTLSELTLGQAEEILKDGGTNR